MAKIDECVPGVFDVGGYSGHFGLIAGEALKHKNGDVMLKVLFRDVDGNEYQIGISDSGSGIVIRKTKSYDIRGCLSVQLLTSNQIEVL